MSTAPVSCLCCGCYCASDVVKSADADSAGTILLMLLVLYLQ